MSSPPMFAPVDVALDRLFPAEGDDDVAVSARRSLARILSWAESSKWPEVAWSFSRLTSCGFPLELSFAPDQALRYTAEIAGAEVANDERLPRAVELGRALGGREPEPALLETLAALQRGGTLLFGSWLGARHLPGRDRYKVYAEIPRDLPDSGRVAVERLFPWGLEGVLQPRGAAVELDSSAYEVYFRGARGTESWQVERLMWRLGVDAALPSLRDLIEEATGRAFERAAGGSNLGFSLAMSRDGAPTAFSVFGYARRLLGIDSAARRRVLSLAAARGWDFSRYERVSAALEQRNQGPSGHGAVAFVVDATGRAALQVTVCPREAAT